MMLPQILDLRSNQRLLDIGGGTSALADLLQQLVAFDNPAICLDASSEALRFGQSHHAERVQGLMGRLPLASTSFDVALLGHVVNMLDEEALDLGLREIRRVLKPGGVCVVWDYGPRSSPWLNRWNQLVLSRLDGPRLHLRSTWQLTSIATDGGFASIRVLNLGPFYLPPIPRVSILLQKSARPKRPRR